MQECLLYSFVQYDLFNMGFHPVAPHITEVKIARPREGLGGRSPPKNNKIFILAL